MTPKNTLGDKQERANSLPSMGGGLNLFFSPRGVVAFGAIPRDPATIARYRRFSCPVYLVNPKGGECEEFPVYRSLDDIEGQIDLAMIRTAPETAATILKECGKAGIPFALVFSSGFSEIGETGKKIEDRLQDISRRFGIRVLGPNTNENAFERFEVPSYNRGGLIGLITQSGHNGRPVVQGQAIGAAFSRWIATGNEVDLEVADFIGYFADDDDTAAIAAYVEGFRNFEALRAALVHAAEKSKPVVMLKIGATAKGASVATSHTGHLTGPDAVIDGLFSQYGVTRVHDLDELCETANLFAKWQADVGQRAALYTISGGSGTLMTEVADSFGIEVPQLDGETQRNLHTFLPDYLTVQNPVDNGGPFVMRASKEDRMAVLDLIAADPNVDFLIVGITGAMGALSDTLAADLMEWAPRAPIPVIATWNSYKVDEPGFSSLVQSGIPVFRSFRTCFGALAAYSRYQSWAKEKRVRPSLRTNLDPSLFRASGALASGQATRLLDAAGIRMARECLVANADEASQACEELGEPVVVKLMSKALPHKSDTGFVKLGVTAATLTDTYDELMARGLKQLSAQSIDGVLVQEQVSEGVELLAGLTYHPEAGSALTIGAGGVLAELLNDTAVRPLPVDKQDILEMLEGLRVFPMLSGIRGRPAVDIDSFCELALALAGLGENAGETLLEVDLNPVVVTENGAVAVDALVIAAGQEPDFAGASR